MPETERPAEGSPPPEPSKPTPAESPFPPPEIDTIEEGEEPPRDD